MKRVAIIGAAQTKHVSRRYDMALSELIFEAAFSALDDAGLSRDVIDSVVLAAHDQIDGRGISTMVTATAAGAYMRDEIRVTEDGIFAVALARARLASEHFKASLVVSWSKCSESNVDMVTSLNFDPFYYRPVGMNEVTALALQACHYEQKFGPVRESLNKLILRERSLGAKNPYAHLITGISAEELQSASVIAWPLRTVDLPPHSDGACALVMVREELAYDGKHLPIWVEGSGWSADSYYLGERSLADLPALKKACDMAYGQAGIDNPNTDLDIVEIHAPSSYCELICLEEMGFCSKGEARFLVDKLSALDWNGPLINSSGGALCTNPYTATGLVRLVEVIQRLRGSEASSGMAHGTTGMAGQSHCVVIVSQ